MLITCYLLDAMFEVLSKFPIQVKVERTQSQCSPLCISYNVPLLTQDLFLCVTITALWLFKRARLVFSIHLY